MTSSYEEAWRDDASCAQVGGDGWFPENGNVSTKITDMCHECPVREACLQYALDNHEVFGIWGGLNYKSRRKLRKQNARAEAA